MVPDWVDAVGKMSVPPRGRFYAEDGNVRNIYHTRPCISPQDAGHYAGGCSRILWTSMVIKSKKPSIHAGRAGVLDKVARLVEKV